MSDVLKKWKSKVNNEAMKKDAEEVAANNSNSDYKEVVAGKYEVTVEKMEIKETKNKENLMISTWLKIIDGDFKGSMIFLNHVFTNGGFGLHNTLEFLRNLQTGQDVQYDDLEQFADLVETIFDDAQALEFVVDYTIDKNGFGKAKIEEVFEK